MKTSCLLLFAIVYASISYSQSSKYNLGTEKYYRFGPSFPTKGYFGNDKSDWDSTSRWGGAFEFGYLYMFEKLTISNNMRFGLNVDYLEMKYHHFTTQQTGGNINGGTISISSKIGPSFSYSPGEYLIFDLYFKANIPWVALNYEANGSTDADDVLMYGGYLGLGYATGFNIRYSFVMFCVELTKVDMIMYDADYDDSYLGDNSNPGSKKTPMPGINFMFGFHF